MDAGKSARLCVRSLSNKGRTHFISTVREKEGISHMESLLISRLRLLLCRGLDSLASFLQNPPAPPPPPLLLRPPSPPKHNVQFVHIQRQRKEDTQSTGDKVTNCPHTHRCGTQSLQNINRLHPPVPPPLPLPPLSAGKESSSLKVGRTMRRLRDE